MRRLALALVLLPLSCSAPVASPSSTPTATPAATIAAPGSPSASPAAITLRDLSVVASGEIRGDHALVLVLEDNGANGGGADHIWDVPLDGTTPRSLVAYTRAERPIGGNFGIDLARQLSPDGHQLVLSDPADVAGKALVIVDLITGNTRVIPTPDIADQPTWSLDGSQIAYRGFALQGPVTKESGLWVVSASGGAARKVWISDQTAGSYSTLIYGWTEDGAGIVVTHDYNDLSLIDIASGSLKKIAGPVHGIAWRPKRPSVVIAADQEGPRPSPCGGAPCNVGRPGEVAVRDTTSGASQIVYRHDNVGTLLSEPRWNPKTDDVLFHWVCGAGAAERPELVLINAVTRAVRAVRVPGCVYSASWNADGTRVLYSDIVAIRVVSADGSGDRELFRPARGNTGVQPRVGGMVAFAPR